MQRFGIRPKTKLLGVNIPILRKLAKEIGTDHKLALQLWQTKIHEARILAGFIADKEKTSSTLMDKWVKDFDSWDIVDLTVGGLFDKTPQAWQKAYQWVKSDKEFIRRSGLVMMAVLSVHDKKAPDSKFIKFFPTLKKYAIDERNFVRKAVNWVVRQIGKRNKNLNKVAIKLAKDIQKIDNKSARWIAADALRELQSEAVQNRIKK